MARSASGNTSSGFILVAGNAVGMDERLIDKGPLVSTLEVSLETRMHCPASAGAGESWNPRGYVGMVVFFQGQSIQVGYIKA